MSEQFHWVGQRVKRREDRRLLKGEGRFIDDLQIPGAYHAAILRSPYPHARIKAIRTEAARNLPGVVGIITGEHVKKQCKPFPVGVSRPPAYYPLAIDKARFVGEPVAMVVAENRYIAEDALDLIEVDYEPLPAVVDPEAALAPGAPILHEELGDNIAWHRRLKYGDPDGAFKDADIVLSGKFRFPRYSSVPLETYGVIAKYDPDEEVLTLWANFQGPFTMVSVLASALNIPQENLRIIVPEDIGGGFGIKSSIYPYMALAGVAAMVTGVPVKWIEDRLEHLQASSSGTDRVSEASIAAKRDGTIIGLRIKALDNVGGYIRAPEPACLLRPLGNLTGPYRIQHVELDGYAVHTNKSPTGPNRGYACQHYNFVVERLIDRLADELGMDGMELRERNLIPPDAFPYTTPTGGIYDSGDYPEVVRRVRALVDYDGFRKRQQEAAAEGRYIGIGICLGVDPSVSNMGYVTVALDPEVRSHPKYLPKSGSLDHATLTLHPSGQVLVEIATAQQGHGHETAAAQIVADVLGLHPDKIRVTNRMDTFTSAWSVSSGTYSSRFSSVVGSAIFRGARQFRERLLQVAAGILDAPAELLEMRDGEVRVKGNPQRSVSLRRIAGATHWNPHSANPQGDPGIRVSVTFGFPQLRSPDSEDRVNSSATYGFVADIAIVEVDPDTGQVKVLDYASAHDAGRIINPQLVEGQVYGSVLHGLAAAFYEEMAYDESGQPLAGTFMDYLCPTAMEAPVVKTDHIESPSPFNELGAKGAGESASETAPVALANAVADALKPLGIEIDQLPLTPDFLWRAISAAQGEGTKLGEVS